MDPGPGVGRAEAVVLDIGGDVGALIVYAGEPALGTEIDLTPAGGPRSHHTHTMIRRRRLVGRDVFAGVYPELKEGRYSIWGHDAVIGEVEVVGGQVSEFDLPGSDRDPLSR